MNILPKLRKLLNLAEKSEGNEAEVAAKLAGRLMAEHSISLGDLQEHELLEQDPTGVAAIYVGQASWKIQIAWDLAAHCNVSAIRSRRYGLLDEETGQSISYYDQTPEQRKLYNARRRHVYAIGYGHRSDLQVWAYLYEVCVREIEAKAKAWKKTGDYHDACDTQEWSEKEGGYRSVGPRTATTRFKESAVQGLSSVLHEQRRAARQQEQHKPVAQQAGLVLKSRADRARSLMKQAHPRLGKYKGGQRQGSAAGRAAGKEVGRNLRSGISGKRAPTSHRLK